MGNDLVPAHMSSVAVANAGFIENDNQLLSPPRLKIIQKSSAEFDQGVPMGKFYNTSSLEAKDEVIFTPLKGHHDYIVFDKDDGKITFQSESEVEAKQTLGEDYWKAKRISILMLEKASLIPAIFSFKGEAYKVGTKLYQLCKVANPGCMFSRAYKLTKEEHQGAGGKYYTPVVSLAVGIEGYSDEKGWLTKEAFEVAKSVAELI